MFQPINPLGPLDFNSRTTTRIPTRISLQNIFQNDDALEHGCCQTIKQQVAQAVARPHIGPACSSEMLGLFEWRLQTRHASGKDGKVQQNGQQLLLDSLLLEAGKCMAHPSSSIV